MELLKATNPLVGVIEVPGDKSISHRSIMLGSLAQGETRIHNFLRADDCLSTLSIFKQLGVNIYDDGDVVVVEGVGLRGLVSSELPLDVGNSGTTIRLIMGILVGQGYNYILTGDNSIQKRPMQRVMTPLEEMGATLFGYDNSEFAPIIIKGVNNLTPIDYHMPVASAQVKSAIIFAALFTNGVTTISEKKPTRNHTEVMLTQFGGKISYLNHQILIPGNQALKGTTIHVPGDFSSAAFFITAALLVPDSDLIIKHVGVNKTRTGLIDVIKKMGGNIEVLDYQAEDESATIRVKSSTLKGIEVSGDIIPSLIDELPLVALLGSLATGETVIKDAKELRVKETDRIDCVARELNLLGANIKTREDGMVIQGVESLHGGNVTSHGDHRIGMMLQITALTMPISETVILKESQAVSVSFPNFFKDLKELMEG
ncbi:3-phosphoshikimate 1-carboxyvinyltransferase [Vagococcus jeotgali]|uniref:3-phosphoshikimate 1-carboxyvinyltransferase n=1 Tax=Vagococcus jeotgali TaxID=3109030 RepID=UPI002DDC2B7A|nr:3-phosphoshikimate 1-carboxyvinyltransferase [Vagococcus sp. B2T-5]